MKNIILIYSFKFIAIFKYSSWNHIIYIGHLLYELLTYVYVCFVYLQLHVHISETFYIATHTNIFLWGWIPNCFFFNQISAVPKEFMLGKQSVCQLIFVAWLVIMSNCPWLDDPLHFIQFVLKFRQVLKDRLDFIHYSFSKRLFFWNNKP